MYGPLLPSVSAAVRERLMLTGELNESPKVQILRITSVIITQFNHKLAAESPK